MPSGAAGAIVSIFKGDFPGKTTHRYEIGCFDVHTSNEKKLLVFHIKFYKHHFRGALFSERMPERCTPVPVSEIFFASQTLQHGYFYDGSRQ